ncbi:hypothetical protein E2C01_015381 [Portunus trituberculatus]|uniref:Uncharacterized protein n=1 Tax=Portunus trituberculatus TaxID=210409 RepID=A0A5B7DMK8_PORTR|nr:hypothetical protein [Portunus trituberculatus]
MVVVVVEFQDFLAFQDVVSVVMSDELQVLALQQHSSVMTHTASITASPVAGDTLDRGARRGAE